MFNILYCFNIHEGSIMKHHNYFFTESASSVLWVPDI